jgi:hypothetical protein
MLTTSVDAPGKAFGEALAALLAARGVIDELFSWPLPPAATLPRHWPTARASRLRCYCSARCTRGQRTFHWTDRGA